ncbi:MAG: hypothetical protein R2911_29310 [Caldilineaceae bacterium]
MAADSGSILQDAEGTSAESTPTPNLSPALVREIADKVYALFMRELQIERHRMRHGPNNAHVRGRKY